MIKIEMPGGLITELPETEEEWDAFMLRLEKRADELTPLSVEAEGSFIGTWQEITGEGRGLAI